MKLNQIFSPEHANVGGSVKEAEEAVVRRQALVQAMIAESAPRLWPTTAAEVDCNILLIGAGPHASRTYIPHSIELRGQGRNLAIVACVEVEQARAQANARVASHGFDAELLFVPQFERHMPMKVELALNRLSERLRVNAVIVATPPEAHAAYVKWALRSNLSVLVDKPVTSRIDAVSDLEQAKGIAVDITELVKEYEAARRRGRICVVVNSHRRWDPVFDFALERVKEVRQSRECPVTSLSAKHADGQFRTPDEWVDIDYHGYNRGIGKLSHSGYHLLDTAYRLLRSGWLSATKPDVARLAASFVQPCALLAQLPAQQLADQFGAEYDATRRYNDGEIERLGRRLGEVDATLLMELGRGRQTIGQCLIALYHNSVSARSWLQPRLDLYKKMGRLKHEHWEIQSGPYQNVVIETRQAIDEHDGAGPKGFSLGDPNHLEIKVFRNTHALGGGARMEVINASELGRYASDRLRGEQVKRAALCEFVDFVQGRIDHALLRSDLTDHVVPAQLMSAGYQSHVRKQVGRNRFVSVGL